RKASLRSSSAPIRRSVSISRLRSVSFSSPTRAPMSANVGSLGSSAAGEPGLAGVGTANAAEVDAMALGRFLGQKAKIRAVGNQRGNAYEGGTAILAPFSWSG